MAWLWALFLAICIAGTVGAYADGNTGLVVFDLFGVVANTFNLGYEIRRR